VIHIRYASVLDAAIIAQIHTSSWQAAYTGIVPDEILNSLDPVKRSQQLKIQINEFPESYGIVYKGEEPTGFICFGRSRYQDGLENDGEIFAIYLHPKFYHQGIGTQLIQWGENELRQKGFQRIFIWVLENNVNARNFYQKNNYVFDGTIKEIKIGNLLNEYRYFKEI